MDDKKKAGLLIAIGGPPKLKARGEDDGGDGGDDKDSMMESAMSDFIEAVHAKDPKAAMDSLHDYLDLCEPDGDEGEGDGEKGKY